MQAHTDNPIALITGRRLKDIPENAETGFERLATVVKPRGAVVYVLQMKDGHVKCGMSSRPRDRAVNITISSLKTMTKWAMTPPILNAREVERSLLQHLGCSGTEWSRGTYAKAVAFLSAVSPEFDNEEKAKSHAVQAARAFENLMDVVAPGALDDLRALEEPAPVRNQQDSISTEHLPPEERLAALIGHLSPDDMAAALGALVEIAIPQIRELVAEAVASHKDRHGKQPNLFALNGAKRSRAEQPRPSA